jgi:hypothetical protein
MARRVTVFFIATLLALPLVARAQTAGHPDFTGAWKVTNIDMPEAGGSFAGGGDRGDRGRFGGGRGGFGGRGGRGFGGARRGQGNQNPNNPNGERPERPQRLEVGQVVRLRQTDERLIVTQDDGQGVATMSNYTLDGKESTNRIGQMTTKSKTKWDGVALVTDMTRSMDTGRGNVDIKSREVRSLSDDRTTMTVRTTMDTPRGKQTMTVTYARVDQ